MRTVRLSLGHVVVFVRDCGTQNPRGKTILPTGWLPAWRAGLPDRHRVAAINGACIAIAAQRVRCSL